MDWQLIHQILYITQRTVSFIGVLIIVTGALYAAAQYIYYLISGKIRKPGSNINAIRLILSRVLVLGLEFIVAGDLIGTTTTPDYYAVGLLAIIVIIRTVLSFSLNRELMYLSKEK